AAHGLACGEGTTARRRRRAAHHLGRTARLGRVLELRRTRCRRAPCSLRLLRRAGKALGLWTAARTCRPVPVIELADVQAAAQRLHGIAHRTPVLTSRTLDGLAGASVYVKAECFQRGGAFKFR